MPAFSALQKEFSVFGVQFTGIAIDSADNVKAFAAQHSISYPLLVAPPEVSALLPSLGNPRGGLPFTLIVDRQDRLRAVRLGQISGPELRDLLNPLL